MGLNPDKTYLSFQIKKEKEKWFSFAWGRPVYTCIALPWDYIKSPALRMWELNHLGTLQNTTWVLPIRDSMLIGVEEQRNDTRTLENGKETPQGHPHIREVFKCTVV